MDMFLFEVFTPFVVGEKVYQLQRGFGDVPMQPGEAEDGVVFCFFRAPN